MEYSRLNPLTGKVATTCEALRGADMARIADAAAKAAPAWATTGPNARRALLNKAADALQAKSAQFVEAMMTEIGATKGWAMFNLCSPRASCAKRPP